MAAEGALISTTQFVQDVLPGLMRDHAAYRVLLATYNDVGDEPVGFLPPGSGGLEITTRCGNHAYTWDDVRRLATVPGEDARIGARASQAQEAVAAATDRSERYNLAVVYFGLTGFDKALTYALLLKRRGQAETVIGLTCNCLLEHKMDKLERPLHERRIDTALVTPACGGQGDFQHLIAGITATWPSVRAF